MQTYNVSFISCTKLGPELLVFGLRPSPHYTAEQAKHQDGPVYTFNAYILKLLHCYLL